MTERGESSSAGAEPVDRPTVRVLLLDAENRVLLFRTVTEWSGEVLWFPPGGGLEQGETYEQAAARELREETGLTDVPLGPELWRRERVFPINGISHRLRERHFLARTAGGEIDTSGFTEDERSSIHAHHWWTLDELRATDSLLVPRDLPTRLAALLTHGPPAEPPFIET